jgi:hypothetical protein
LEILRSLVARRIPSRFVELVGQASSLSLLWPECRSENRQAEEVAEKPTFCHSEARAKESLFSGA